MILPLTHLYKENVNIEKNSFMRFERSEIKFYLFLYLILTLSIQGEKQLFVVGEEIDNLKHLQRVSGFKGENVVWATDNEWSQMAVMDLIKYIG